MSIAQITGIRPPDVDGQAYGLEVELEHVRAGHDIAPPGWTITNDGSLRNMGIEFVSPPKAKADLMQDITTLFESAERRGWQATARCGTHVHADMSGRSLQELGAVVATYLCLEPALFTFAGDGREECVYCIPIYESPSDLTGAMRAALDENTVWVERGPRVDGTNKYAALYLEPLMRFNTIEFRAAEAYAEAQDLMRWLELIDRVVRTTYPSAEAVVEAFDRDERRAGREVLGDLWRDDFEGLMDAKDSVGVAAMLLDGNQGGWDVNIPDFVEVTDAMRNFWQAPGPGRDVRVEIPRRYQLDNIPRAIEVDEIFEEDY